MMGTCWVLYFMTYTENALSPKLWIIRLNLLIHAYYLSCVFSILDMCLTYLYRYYQRKAMIMGTINKEGQLNLMNTRAMCLFNLRKLFNRQSILKWVLNYQILILFKSIMIQLNTHLRPTIIASTQIRTRTKNTCRKNTHLISNNWRIN